MPEKTIVAVAIPFRKQQFDTLFDRGDSDFIRSLAEVYKTEDKITLWNKYSKTAESIIANLAHFAKRGAIIIEELTTKRLQSIADSDIAIIIAHHSNVKDEIEMTDRMVTTSEFVEAIPTEFSGLLDLSSCFSSTIQLPIKMHCPNCHVLAVKDRIPLQRRITAYNYIINAMSQPSTRRLIQKQINNDTSSENQIALVDMEPYMREYLEIVKSAYAIILKVRNGSSVSINPEVIYLGGSIQSSVYAPKQVEKGQVFQIQIAIHKSEDTEIVEIAAREADGSASLRNPLRLSFELKKDDYVDIALKIDSAYKGDFKAFRSRDSFQWGNEPRFTSFNVLVSDQCRSKSCHANIKICVNKLPAGTITFTSEVVDELPQNNMAAEISLQGYDKGKEMKEAKSSLLFQLNKELELLTNGKYTFDSEEKPIQRYIDICRNSIQLLEDIEQHHKNNQVFRVFISSTSDLSSFRNVMKERVLDCSMYPEMYEKWPQKEKYPRDYCIEKVLLSDIFVCILGPNYGYIEPTMDTSMTEIEFRVALLSGKPILVYVLEDFEDMMFSYLPEHQIEVNKQRNLINELDKKRMVEFFKDENGLALLSTRELSILQKEMEYERTAFRQVC